MLAQGGTVYKRKFLQPDMAARLLEMSQNSGNDALQVSVCPFLSISYLDL